MGADPTATTRISESLCLSSSSSESATVVSTTSSASPAAAAARTAATSIMAKKSEVHRMVSDISSAIQSSDLLSLLQSFNRDNVVNASSHNVLGDKEQPKELSEALRALNQDRPASNVNGRKGRRRKERRHNNNNKDKNNNSNNYAVPPKCLADIPQSMLDERITPIKKALERVDAQKLLNLETIHISKSLEHEDKDNKNKQQQKDNKQQQQQHNIILGPRVREG